MKQIDVICTDKLYTEMLCLELEALGYTASGKNTGHADITVCEAGLKTGESCITFSSKEGEADLVRPFVIEELAALIEARVTEDSTSVQEELYVSPCANYALYRGERVELSELEHRILEFLCLNRDRCISQMELAETFFGDGNMLNPVRVYISYLRNKLDEHFGVKLIYTVRGKGYMLKTQ